MSSHSKSGIMSRIVLKSTAFIVPVRVRFVMVFFSSDVSNVVRFPAVQFTVLLTCPNVERHNNPNNTINTCFFISPFLNYFKFTSLTVILPFSRMTFTKYTPDILWFLMIVFDPVMLVVTNF